MVHQKDFEKLRKKKVLQSTLNYQDQITQFWEMKEWLGARVLASHCLGWIPAITSPDLISTFSVPQFPYLQNGYKDRNSQA